MEDVWLMWPPEQYVAGLSTGNVTSNREEIDLIQN